MTPLTSDLARSVHRRTLRVLVGAQALGALGMTIGIATASLLARDLSGSETWAGMAQTSQVFGTALAAWVLARQMRLHGRRSGLATGLVAGAVGSLLAVVAGVVGSMALLLVGTFLLGSATAANSGARYAATDLAPDRQRARALAIVVWATTIGAVVGPNLVGVSGEFADAVGIPRLTGPFALGSIGMLLAALVLTVWLRPDPLLTAQALEREASAGLPALPPTGSWQRVGVVLRERPVVLAAMVGLAAAHAVMVSVMVMTPLHMEHGGAELTVIGFVISIHVLGMFALSPVAGWAADRFGRPAVLALGGLVLVAALALAGTSPEGESWRITTGLFLLGLGWSLATVAASTMLADHVPLSARTDVQGAADMAMSLTAAAAAAVAGVVVGAWGYPALNALAAVLAGVALLAASAALRTQPSPDRSAVPTPTPTPRSPG